ncbi:MULTISPECIES: thiamine pyrophosphate-binding protein [unclassified Ruegeria]|uniref:thiamine pyrophosphate-binding protein n=1 Tax=unclassified Ruegeria TaxID=2625375 RepID=UPI001491B3E3|nr:MULTISPECIES: thiamine pyrophosphate-binding protein [unclassified Ruegeria]NOD34486.1 thiamine pyrophosphate-binding protein [Ruegeria sp. HKCCD7296]NOD47599.1 thiamine pyrophosphate-binding protein [Ruegeria sp. HKCCD5849]NOD52738.1 thiamine pyrophosphate-binding protein [Ruegeria sp. HKCCD5851]NOD66157.1 thiamine pyrophosphate-binding protein [Ruegeria sp. HKCCD7303]NOE40290.1 thiamine pyrophosphate-binding protein [Ruegeria sp. HKCCD7319]
MTTITGGEAVYRVLKANGIDTVFGLLGGSMLELYDAMYQGGQIAYVGARDERAAGHMADAWARMTGKPGVVLGAQAGPGVVNIVTAVAEAQLAYSPLVVIAGAITRADQCKDTFQEIDQVALFAPISKRSVMVTDPARLAPMLEDAIRLANTGRRGPVVLHVPRDLLAADIPAIEPAPVNIARPGPAAPADIAAIAKLLSEAERPVIFAGGGFKWGAGRDALTVLVEKLEIPVVASTGHADVMPHGHRWFAGQAGPRGNVVASGLTREADVMVVLGARLGFNSTFHSNEYVGADTRIAHVDIEGAAVGRYFPAEIAAQGDARLTAEALIDATMRPNCDPWREAFRSDMATLAAERAAEAELESLPMHPRRALAEIRATLPEDAIVTLDTGNTCLQAADRLAHYAPVSLITPLDFGLVGFGLAAAIGAKAAAPDRPVVAIMGDGAVGYTMIEIQTAIQHYLPITIIVLDNEAWGAEKAYQQEFYGGRLLGAEIRSPRFDKFAELCGGKGIWVDGPGGVGPALEQAIASNETTVIQAKIDPGALMTLRKDLFKSPRNN